MHEKGNTATSAETSGFVREDFSSVYRVPAGFAHQLERSSRVQSSNGEHGKNQLVRNLLLREAGP